MHISLLAGLTVATLLLGTLCSHAETELPHYAIGLGFEVSSGTFGSNSTSTYATLPVTFDWFPTERLDLELTIPLLYQQTANTGHALLGTNMQNSVTTSAKSVARGSMMGGGGGGSMLGGDYGLGDITLTSGYAVVQDSNSFPRIRPSVYLKFPTANASNGSGTGKFDIGAGVAVSKWLGNWQPFAEGRFVVQGAAHDEAGAENFVTADAGIAYSWNDRLATSAFARFGSTLFDSMPAPLEVRLKTIWRFGKRTYSEAYVLKGFSDGSPDYGGGISAFMEF